MAIGLYAASFVQRRRGRELSGKVLGYLGFTVILGSGFLGGHLAYRQAAGANHAEGIPSRFPQGWQPMGVLDGLPENELASRSVAGVPVVVLRRGSAVHVLSSTCTHLSGPLNEGTLLDADTDEPCVQCPWHGSVFSLTTGDVVHGPATSPENRFETRVVDGMVEVLLPHAG
jgi:nitrite reductase/ring-hydroxylating ferredoxin subunit